MSTFRILLTGFVVLAVSTGARAQQLSRQEKLEQDRARMEADGRWIYNDPKKGFEQAKQTGKPLMVVLRCVPCEECVKLDDELVERNEEIVKLMDSFVCVRQVSTNGLDLQTFQFDTDQSFAVFFLNGDGTIYGRFGTRSHRTEWIGDVSVEAMAAAMKGALALHNRYPGNREQLAGKQGPKREVASPEQYPSLKDKYSATLKPGNELVKSCIHCHQIGDAQREYYWTSVGKIPQEIIFQYPHPKVIGLTMDPYTRATIKEVNAGSAAADAGLIAGDELITLDGQPLVSIADIQWVLHQTSAMGDELLITARRDGKLFNTKLQLNEGWRKADDLSWRVSSWGVRKMVLGGLVLETLPEDEKSGRKIAADKMALRVKYVGQYNEHAAAKRAGVRKDDIIVSYDGRDDLDRESDVFDYALSNHRPGDQVELEILRAGKRQTVRIPIQP